VRKQKPDLSNVVVFDIETTSLDANRGHILCAAAKRVGQSKVYTWRLDENPLWGERLENPDAWEYDLPIAEGLRDMLESAKAVVAYYGGYMKFDVPFVNTRLMRWGAAPLRQMTVVDPYQMAKSKLKLARTNLDSVSTLLGCKHKKTHVPWEEWHRAKFGDSKALDKLLKYNINDVHTLEDVYLKMLPLFPSHPLTGPNGSNTDMCRVCGGPTYSKGWRYLAKTRVHDVVCKLCGWRGNGKTERL
jgi:uncharacterized protein YprB with RNaseH-like and TPR domain